MSSETEAAFVAHMLDVDSMAYLATQGFDSELLPTEAVREVWEYAQEYFSKSGGAQAVSVLALKTYEVSKGRSFLDVLADLDIDPEDTPDLTIFDVVDKLRGQYSLNVTAEFTRQFSIDMVEASNDDRIAVLSKSVSDLNLLLATLTSRRNRVTLADGLAERFRAYENYVPGDHVGMTMGLAEVDEHWMKVKAGELFILGGSPKSGKSLFGLRAFHSEWRAGRRCVMVTLENSIEMTLDRFICLACGVDSDRYQRHLLDESEVERMRALVDEVAADGLDTLVLSPDGNQRDVVSIMSQARSLEADTVIIDQLSHIRPVHSGHRDQRNQQVREIVQLIKEQASVGSHPMSVMLLAQIKREGVESAQRRGHHLPEDMAESSEIEKSADILATIYRSSEMEVSNTLLLETQAFRRGAPKSWLLDWFPGQALARVRSEYDYADLR